MATETVTAYGVIVNDSGNLPRWFSKKVVLALAGDVADSTLWRREQKGTFPKRIRLSSRLTVWNQREVMDWLARQGGAARE